VLRYTPLFPNNVNVSSSYLILIVGPSFWIMVPTKKNRSLLRPRAAKKRGNPIFISSQLILEREREPAPVFANEVTEIEKPSSVKYLIKLTNKRDTAPEDASDSIELDTRQPQLKRQRIQDVSREEDNKHDGHESSIVSLPLNALERRLDFSSSCDNNKCRPDTIAVFGEIRPKEISLSASSEGGNGRYIGMSTFKAFDTAFNNKWDIEDDFREAFPEIESSPSATKRCKDDKDSDGEGQSEKQLQSDESSDTIENDERHAREKRVCKSVFDLVCLMELRRVGLVKPPKNLTKHFQLIEEIRECSTYLRNRTLSIDSSISQTPLVLETSSVANQEVPIVESFESIPVEDSYSTIEYNDEASLAYAAEDIDINVANATFPEQEDEDNISHGQPILRRRRKQHNSWQDIRRDSQKRVSFKDKLNPIAAAEYDEMDIVELDMYDELPNQFRSNVPKEFTRHWSTQDTEEFYKCVALLGLDFGRIATIMGRTQKQITNKYKTEQKNNNQRLRNALIRQGEFFEYRQKYRF
jgi:hypothetical protein